MFFRPARARRARLRGRIGTIVVLAASLAGCGIGVESPARPASGASGASGASSPTASAVPGTAAEGTVAPPAPGGPAAPRLAAAAGASDPVGPPEGSPIAGVRRDCGMSTTLGDGRALWVFCDTGVWSSDGRLRSFTTTSAALAEAGAPTTLVDPLDAEGRPSPLIRTDPSYPACPGDARASAWPMSAVTVPADAGRDRVFVWYQNVCLVPRQSETFDIGLAVLEYAHGQPLDTPLQAQVLEPRLFPKRGLAGSYGVASEIVGDQAYLWWCDHGSTPCTVARAPVDRLAEALAYRYWDGTAWVEDADRAAPAVPPAPARPDERAVGVPAFGRIGAQVRWVPALDRLVLVEVDAASTIAVRFASHPEGPWSEPQLVTLDDCAKGFPDDCIAATVHPQLSDAGHLAIGWFDPARPLGPVSPTRVARLPLDPPAR